MRAKPLPLLQWSVTFAAMFSAGAIGFTLPSVGAHPTLPLFGTGIAVAACIRWGRRMWPSVLAAGAGIDLWTHLCFVASLGVGLGATACAVFTAWFLERRGFDPDFGRARDVPLFILAVCLGTLMVPTLGLIGFRLAGDAAAFTDPLRWIRWWSNTTAGVLLVGPLLVAMSRRSLAQCAEHWGEAILWLAAVVICCAGALSFDRSGVGRPLIVMFSFLLVIVA